MISGAHVIVYSKDAEADRLFFRDVLKLASVDPGHGWLIFALPPAEAAFHPAEANDRHELYFMCEDLKTSVHNERWGSITTITLPGGGEIGLYQPQHPTAFNPRAT